MQIPSKTWTRYIADLRKINNKAAELMTAYLEAHTITTDADLIAALDYGYALATKYGEASGALAATMYDRIAELQRAHVPAAIPAETATYPEVAAAVRGSMLNTDDPAAIAASIGRLVKMAGVDTIMHNAARDRAEFAWIPQGETCAFCLVLASNGWRRVDARFKHGHAQHIHANCDCTYAVRFNPDLDVEGYNNGAKYRAMYDNAEGKGTDKINSIRRRLYADNADKINAQKRAAYERHKEAGSST